MQRLTLGLVVNPFAGVGGPAGLKGSDGAEVVAQALARGVQLRAPERAQRCLTALDAYRSQLTLLTYGGAMGENLAQAIGWSATVVGQVSGGESSASDTQAAVMALQAAGVDLLLFVGGDGTARDVCRTLVTTEHEQQPVLGIPSGVKMHSGVFAISPEAAAQVVIQMLSGSLVELNDREVRDIDEDAFRRGVVKSRHYGDMFVPEDSQFVQQCKEGGVVDEALVLVDIAAELRENLDDDVWYLVGAGTTAQALMDDLGLENSLLGIDLICNEKLIAADLSGPALERRLEHHKGPVVAILSITGGQGSLIGRGNQQLTPTVLRRLGRDNVWVFASKAKITALNGRALLMDSNDTVLDRQWQGYVRVITGYRESILYPLGYALS